MSISLPNQILGQVEYIEWGAICAVIKVDVGNGVTITCVETAASVQAIGLEIGDTVTVCISAFDIDIALNAANTSFSNVIGGTIESVTMGTVDASVAIETADFCYKAVVDKHSVEALGLVPGVSADVCFRAVSAHIATS